MDPSEAGTVHAIISMYDRIKELFSDFRPETRTMTINFARKTSQIGFQITVPEGMRKSHRKVRIPAMQGYSILRMTDEGFQEQRHIWKMDGEDFVLDAKDLPSSERYLVEMEGKVAGDLDGFIYIKPAVNRDNDENDDRYWLESSIKKIGILENIYTDFDIDEVNFGVKINVDKMFKLAIPEEIKDKADAQLRLLNASENWDRNKILRAAMAYRRYARQSPSYGIEDFFKIVQRVTGGDLIREHMRVEKPYDVGSIMQPVKYTGIVPQNIEVQAVTRLTLKEPIARGYLIFEREKYLKRLRSEFEKMQ